MCPEIIVTHNCNNCAITIKSFSEIDVYTRITKKILSRMFALIRTEKFWQHVPLSNIWAESMLIEDVSHLRRTWITNEGWPVWNSIEKWMWEPGSVYRCLPRKVDQGSVLLHWGTQGIRKETLLKCDLLYDNGLRDLVVSSIFSDWEFKYILRIVSKCVCDIYNTVI